MEEFSCCSLWKECQAEGKCAQRGNSVISKEEYLRCCRLARRYQAEYEKETQVVYKVTETGQLSIFV
ncbi:MAG: hypothetical protein K6U74_13590 [Firmicutes bacterium]|nr:hypothetical protein [Bacillota bacterium]